MSKKSSEARAKRSVTATAARPAWRRAKTSPCSVAMWTCSTGSSPARSATSSSAAASSRQRSGRSLAASTAPSDVEDRAAAQVG